PASSAVETAMLRDPGLGQRAAPLDRPQGVAATELILRRRGRLKVFARDDPLRQVVEPLEAIPSRDSHLAGREQMLESPLRRLPVPHLAGHRALPLEGSRRQGAALPNRLEHLSLHFAILLPFAAPPVAVLQMGHSPLEERVVLDRAQAGLVRPVLEDSAL